MGPPHYIGIKDASIHGVGGFVVGEGKACVPTVFRHEWVKREVRKTNQNQGGTLTNSDLEMAGLLMLWLVMEDVCELGSGTHVALFSDNSPTVSWVNRLASRNSKVADQLVRALALRLKVKQVSPLCTLHIAGEKNEMTDVPSRSFGSEPKWHCKTDSELLDLYNSLFPLPNPKDSWTVYQLSPKIISMIYSALRTGVLGMEEWRQLPRLGGHIGESGASTANLFELTLSYRGSHSKKNATQHCHSPPQLGSGGTGEDVKSELERFQRRSRPLTRRSPWPLISNPSRCKDQRTSSL